MRGRSGPTPASTASSPRAATGQYHSRAHRVQFYLRAPRRTIAKLLRRYEGCAQGAATATGCRVTVTSIQPFTAAQGQLHHGRALRQESRAHRLSSIPMTARRATARRTAATSARPSHHSPLHPHLARRHTGHSREFAEWAKSPPARAGMWQGPRPPPLSTWWRSRSSSGGRKRNSRRRGASSPADQAPRTFRRTFLAWLRWSRTWSRNTMA
jgi:hypothetical protein